MKKEMLKKSILLFCCAGLFLVGKAQQLPDSIVMTVAGKPILLSEFLFIAGKNGDVNFTNSKALDEYVTLFRNFKLKVADAEANGLDQTKAFSEELEGYRNQLVNSYLSDKEGEEKAARELYDRGNEILRLSYLFFRFPSGKTLMNDTLASYQLATAARERLDKGESMAQVAVALRKEGKELDYEEGHGFQIMQAAKVVEDALYSLPVGGISSPVRAGNGYYVLQVLDKKPHPGSVHVSHILIGVPDDADAKTKEEALKKAEAVYDKVKKGEDFATLAKTYSTDAGSASNGGDLKTFGPGKMVLPFEEAAFSLTTPGQVSAPVESQFGYHIILLHERFPRRSFEEEKQTLMRFMAQGERNFEFYKSFDDRMKKEYEYVFYPEAYKELEALCNDYFPDTPEFFEKAEGMEKTLLSLTGEEFGQNVFAYYMMEHPFSAKTYAGDFMQEVYDLFVRELVTNAERANVDKKYPEYHHLMQEYRDGILLFEISNQKIWTKPAAEQPALEAKWIKELTKKYPVVINKKALKRLLQ